MVSWQNTPLSCTACGVQLVLLDAIDSSTAPTVAVLPGNSAW